jgi:hypothetical protein
MLNHSAEPNCEITFDDMGNCQVTAMYDIQPGTPLTISYGDPTNPTPIFAQYGFLPADCTTLFCKAVHLERYIKDLGIDYKDLLIQVESGEIAPKVRRELVCQIYLSVLFVYTLNPIVSSLNHFASSLCLFYSIHLVKQINTNNRSGISSCTKSCKTMTPEPPNNSTLPLKPTTRAPSSNTTINTSNTHSIH